MDGVVISRCSAPSSVRGRWPRNVPYLEATNGLMVRVVQLVCAAPHTASSRQMRTNEVNWTEGVNDGIFLYLFLISEKPIQYSLSIKSKVGLYVHCITQPLHYSISSIQYEWCCLSCTLMHMEYVGNKVLSPSHFLSLSVAPHSHSRISIVVVELAPVRSRRRPASAPPSRSPLAAGNPRQRHCQRL
jgi:hypothetical protein